MCRVSIVIPAYNSGAFLPETLDSILRQDWRDYEIIVVDDGSTDNTAEVVRGYPGVKYLHERNSGGCSRPRNVGIRAAVGEYVTIFDADDIMLPEKIGLQAAFLHRHPHIQFVFTDFSNFREDDLYPRHTDSCPIFRNLPKTRVAPGQYIIGHSHCYETLMQENFASAPSMMFRKCMWEEVGGFDERLDSSEDIDFSLRVAGRHDFGYIDKVCYLRRLHGSSMSSRTEKVLTRKIAVRLKHLATEKSARAQEALVKSLAGLYLSLVYHYRDQARYGRALDACRASIRMKPFPNRAYLAGLKTLAAACRSRLSGNGLEGDTCPPRP